MKKGTYLLLIIGIAVVSCEKDTGLRSLHQQIQGTWELTRTFGGWSGVHEYTPGNGNTIAFENNSYVKHFVSADTSYSAQGTYTLYKSQMPCGDRRVITQVSFDSVIDNFADEIMILQGQLFIGNTQCISDGAESYYRRIK